MNKPGVVKLAVLGAGAVGKSTLIARLVSGDFIETTMTVGFDVDTWKVAVDGSHQLQVCMFDFGGQEQFRFFQAALCTGAKIALLVFDCSSFRSLLAVDEWIGMVSNIPNARKLLVGNKIDVPGGMAEEEIREVAETLGLEYILVSSKDGTNFEKLRDRLSTMVKELETIDSHASQE